MRNKKTKRQYHVRNWSEYNAALVKRGSLTVWIEQASLDNWLEAQKSGRRGASLTYSDAAIETILVLKAVYRLPLRGAQGFAHQGFAHSVLRLMGLFLPVPHYSTLRRRQIGLALAGLAALAALAALAELAALAMPRLRQGEAIHLVVDSTGCKVYGL